MNFGKGLSVAWHLSESHGQEALSFLLSMREETQFDSPPTLFHLLLYSVSPNPSSAGYLHPYQMRKLRKQPGEEKKVNGILRNEVSSLYL